MGILNIFDIVGTFAFAISRSFRAIKHELDLLGLLVLATVTGVGGGVFQLLYWLGLGDHEPRIFGCAVF